jgi:hypothetical protein
MSDHFDSRKVPAGATDDSEIHIVKRPCQVLPYCVITLEVNIVLRNFKYCRFHRFLWKLWDLFHKSLSIKATINRVVPLESQDIQFNRKI